LPSDDHAPANDDSRANHDGCANDDGCADDHGRAGNVDNDAPANYHGRAVGRTVLGPKGAARRGHQRGRRC